MSWRRLSSGNSDAEVSKILSDLNVTQQRLLLDRRRELVTPINEQEKETVQKVSETYYRVFEANNAIIDLLDSLK